MSKWSLKFHLANETKQHGAQSPNRGLCKSSALDRKNPGECLLRFDDIINS